MLTEHERAVGLLHGAVAQGVGRATDLGIVEFLSSTGDEICIHIQCPFRFLHESKIILGSDDLSYPGKRPAEGDEDPSKNTMFDTRAIAMTGFLGRFRPTVTSATVADGGFFSVAMSNSFQLQIFPDSSSGKVEMWRVFTRGSDEHFGFPPNLV
ncbi:hypothetical protein [Actinocorallia sp. A-T 12471]|uniref:hypothetical protein n=1 Tax=Actinocorallia sp. A-T 12471 TaxID=3089813 RepID=UPI0029D125D4|nr:hypothetical protein [Actinocorallia sp. A-T 12471]MDX6739264.1 hypothetical protein [Actinocorallia sp. A-T 12471]